MNVKRIIYFVFLTCALFLVCNPANTELRVLYEDAIVVERSALIIVGHIKEGSIQYVPHRKEKNEGTSYEHHATLVITEVLKGKCDEKKIPIIIHYGLTPVVGGYVKTDSFMLNPRGNRKDYPKDIIEIFDTGSSAHGGPSLVKDAREDNLWFLRKLSGIYGEKAEGGTFGIRDPEDLRPFAQKDYFLAYMSDNPEALIAKYIRETKEDLQRAQRYLDHTQVQRIIQIQDVNERLEKLLPFYIAGQGWNMKRETRDAIISCSDTAGSFLLKVFDNPKFIEKKGDIILLFREINYRESAPKIIELLKANNEFWLDKTILK